MTSQLQRTIRAQLNIATMMLCLAGASLACIAAYASAPDAVREAAHTVAGLSPMELMALVTMLSLALCGYLIRLLFTRLLSVLDENARANKETARLLAERPCIRRPENN
jgi:hypothetical protein